MVALQTLLHGIATRKYGNKTYGASFWKPLVNEYSEKIEAASQKDTSIRGLVSEKNKSKEQIRKVLNAVMHLLKANYPDTYATELRKWGFQQEKY
jgi:hypothetical protein